MHDLNLCNMIQSGEDFAQIYGAWRPDEFIEITHQKLMSFVDVGQNMLL